MNTIILAAGYATRLLPLTEYKPKPLLSIKGKPIIEYITDSLANIKEIERIFVVTNHKFYSKFVEWQNTLGEIQDKVFEIIDDGTVFMEERLGAIGDINFVIGSKNINSDLLVVAGDNLFDFKLEDFVRFAKEKAPFACIGLFDVKDKYLAKRYGIVSLNGSGRVMDFQEKPKVPHSTLASMCLYYFPKDNLKYISEYIKDAKAPDAPGNYIDWLSKKTSVYSWVVTGMWFDVGDILSYSRAIWKFR